MPAVTIISAADGRRRAGPYVGSGVTVGNIYTRTQYVRNRKPRGHLSIGRNFFPPLPALVPFVCPATIRVRMLTFFIFRFLYTSWCERARVRVQHNVRVYFNGILRFCVSPRDSYTTSRRRRRRRRRLRPHPTPHAETDAEARGARENVAGHAQNKSM